MVSTQGITWLFSSPDIITIISIQGRKGDENYAIYTTNSRALNWSFQLLFYIYDMLSGMSRADVKNVLLIMHTDSVILGVFPRT